MDHACHPSGMGSAATATTIAARVTARTADPAAALAAELTPAKWEAPMTARPHPATSR